MGKEMEQHQLYQLQNLIPVRLQAYLRLEFFFILASKCHFRSQKY
uniref:PARP catalytic domain-containing protein n=1 Tax=Utricularia reniformis TaxID=192314 RepID=A0A1Y0B4N3_9LAMI|nr:hypothetical protein AEK19_MT2236 [Utricularia reniformis]ART32381.1 hypothetical protein AEK19_MT2236 [Utricularia reniformis]